MNVKFDAPQHGYDSRETGAVMRNRLADRVGCHQLRNGSNIYLLENHANQTVDLMGFLEGGMFKEPSSQTGISNLCVSMLDRGTVNYTHSDLSEALESNGALLSFHLTPEMMTFRVRCLAEDFAMLLQILGETLSTPTFPADQLKLVKEDARSGLREAAYDTFFKAYERCAGLLLGDEHPYAREPLGTLENIERFSRDEIAAYHRDYLLGAPLQIAIVGDIDPDDTLALLEKHLGSLPVSGGEVTAGALRESGVARSPGTLSREHIAIADKEQVDIVFARPGVARCERRFDAYGLANFIFGGSFVSRLNKQLRDNEGLTYGAQSAIVSGLHPGFWYSYIGVAASDVERAVAGTLREMKHFAADGITADELETARLHLTGSFPIRLETNRVVAAVLLNGIRIGLGLDYIDTYFDRVAAITKDEVDAAGRDLFNADDLVIVSSGNGSGKMD
jgi:zinc protease